MTTVADALASINRALQGESRDQREDRIWEQWCEAESFNTTTDEDAVWFIGHSEMWADPFMACAGFDVWPREIEAWLDCDPNELPWSAWHEPMSTEDVIERLRMEHLVAKQRVTDDPSPDSLKDERNLHIAVEGLKARYARTGDDNMGW